LICYSPSLSLSTPQEQGRTLELERERIGREIGEGEEQKGRKHQHHSMDTINIFNLVHGELKKGSFYFLDFPPKSNLWFLVKDERIPC